MYKKYVLDNFKKSNATKIVDKTLENRLSQLKTKYTDTEVANDPKNTLK